MHLEGMNRYQAFGIHFGVSLLLFFVLAILVFQLWYPGLLFESEQGWRALLLIAGVDLVLGPTLTLLVFAPEKKSLKFDLFVIFLIQIAALIYGVYTIHGNRPVGWILFDAQKGFNTVYAHGLPENTLAYISSQSTRSFYFHLREEDLDKDAQAYADFVLQPDNIQPTTSDGFKEHTLSGMEKNSNGEYAFVLDRGIKDSIQLVLNPAGEPIAIERQAAQP